jgi:uncharacterized caspase-like protein/rhodanese-related sulfurtransferase
MRLQRATAIVLALLAAVLLASGQAWAQSRVALVIGNSSYAHGGRLPNPANDAAAVAQALRQVGFSVTSRTDLGRVQFEETLKSFSREAAGADIAVVYYAGHGMEKGGTNYLIPTDAVLAADSDVDFETVSLDLVLRSVEGARRLKLVILDACRNNPFLDAMRRTGGSRSIGRGLARVEPEGDLLVAYAAREGSTAEDGEGANSPFASALVQRLKTPGLEVGFLFRKVRDDVLTATAQRQEPAIYGSLGGDEIYFVPANTPAPSVQAAAAPAPTAYAPPQPAYAPPDAKTVEFAYWQSVAASNDAAQLNAYLTRYPKGEFSDLARAKIASIDRAAHPAAAPAVAPTPAPQTYASLPASPENPRVRYFETLVAPDGPPTALVGATVVSTAQLYQQLLARKANTVSFVLIDARGCTGEITISGAVCLNPQFNVAAVLQRVPVGEPIVVFCHNGGCGLSYELGRRLLLGGYQHVYWYRGGIDAWTAAGLPTTHFNAAGGTG